MPGKTSVQVRLQNLQDRLLDEPVKNGRDAKLPHPSPALGDELSLHPLGLVGPSKQLLADLLPVFPEVSAELNDGHPVDPRTPFVAPDTLQCVLNVRALYHPFHQIAPC